MHLTSRAAARRFFCSDRAASFFLFAILCPRAGLVARLSSLCVESCAFCLLGGQDEIGDNYAGPSCLCWINALNLGDYFSRLLLRALSALWIANYLLFRVRFECKINTVHLWNNKGVSVIIVTRNYYFFFFFFLWKMFHRVYRYYNT